MTVSELEAARARANHARYEPGQSRGHYESYFQRANHPERPLAFWIRYTLFSPEGRPEEAIGELWSLYFDGEAGAITVAKSEVPFERCRFARNAFETRIADARIEAGHLAGHAESRGHRVEWSLSYRGGQAPLFDLPLALYEARLPRAKALVGVPLCRYQGSIVVDGDEKPIEGWIGSQNHNWGSRHTDHYAWGQVAGFDDAPESFLEVATARLRLGPIWSPFMTPIVLRHRGEEHALNTLGATLRNRGRFSYFDWSFRGESQAVRISGRIHAEPDHFVALTYYNPPGGRKCCLNSKIAGCRLEFEDKRTGRRETLVSRHRAAFEILSDDFDSHGVQVAA